MAAPSEATIQTQIAERIHLLETLREYTTDNAQNLLAQENTAVTDMEGDYEDDSIAGISSFRGAVSDALASGIGRSIIDPKLLDYAKFLGSSERNPFRIIYLLNQHFAATAQSIKSRVFTYGAGVAGGSNVGDGDIYRVTKDRFGNDLEACTAEVKTFECTNDQTSGASIGAEQFRARGKAASRDNIDRESGSGAIDTINGLNSGGGTYIRNASFSSSTGLGFSSSFDLTNWDIDDPTVCDLDDVNFYRPGNSQDFTPASLQMSGAVIVSQSVSDLDPDVPIIGRLAYNATVGTGVGDLVIRLGQLTVSVIAVEGSPAGWNTVRFVIDGAAAWAQNITVDDLKLEIEFVPSGAGVLLVDDVVLEDAQLIEGTYWGIIGGAIAFLINDTISVTDSNAALGVIQTWLWRIYGRHLRSSGAPTWVDP